MASTTLVCAISVRDVFTRPSSRPSRRGRRDAADTIDPFPSWSRVQLHDRHRLPLPIAVAAAWMGLDIDTARLLREESPAITRMLTDPQLTPSPSTPAQKPSPRCFTEFLPLAADRRRHPGDDLISFIAADNDLELDDVVTTAIIIAIAGHETTANLLGTAMVRLLTPQRRRHPAYRYHRHRRRSIDHRVATPRRPRASRDTYRHARSHVLDDVTIARRRPRPRRSRPPPTVTPPFSTQPDQLRTDRTGPRTAHLRPRGPLLLGSSIGPPRNRPSSSNNCWHADPHSAGTPPGETTQPSADHRHSPAPSKRLSRLDAQPPASQRREEYGGNEYGGLPVKYVIFTNHTVYQRNSPLLATNQEKFVSRLIFDTLPDEPCAPARPGGTAANPNSMRL